MKTICLLALLLSANFAARSARAQEQTLKEVVEACTTVKSPVVPLADRPSPAEKVKFEGCKPLALFYGIDGPEDAVAARKCAWFASRNEVKWRWMDWSWSDDVGPGEPFDILAHIYATGDGVPRNFAVALHYACGFPSESPDKPTQTDQDVVKAILQMKAAPAKQIAWPCTAPFRWCGDLIASLDAIDQQSRLGKIESRFTPTQKTAYAKAYSLYDAYRDSETTHGAYSAAGDEDNVDSSGENWVAVLEAMERGNYASFTHDRLVKEDAELNRVYRAVIAAAPKQQRVHQPMWNEEVRTRDDLRQSERHWLQYRDAWVAFCALRYPKASADAIRTALTIDRTQEIGSDADLTTVKLQQP